MRKNYSLFTLIFTCVLFTGYAQNIEGFLRPYADEIVNKTAFEFTDGKTGKTHQSTNNLPVKQNLEITSEYLHWRYTSALVYEGLMELGKTIKEDRYSDFAGKAFTFLFDNQSYIKKVKAKGYNIKGLENFMKFKGLWNDGAQTAALVTVYQKQQRDDYLEYMKLVADFFLNYDKDGGSASKNKNIDQIYTKGVFMARMGELTGEEKYFNYCVEQVLETDRLFYDPLTGLYSQYYYSDLNVTNNIKWLRGSGWAAMGIVNVLASLPKDHPGYEKVLKVFQKIVIGISSYQTKSGLWHHLVDRSDCFEETSGSTFIVYAIAKGINIGILDPNFRDVAMAGWQGIVSMQDAEGKINNVTGSVSHSTSPSYYYNNTFDEANTHFYGPLFLAGVEMMKLYKTHEKPAPRNWNVKNSK